MELLQQVLTADCHCFQGNMALTGRDLWMILIAILLPPLAVFIEVGHFGAEVIINICLTLLGYLPGVALL